MWPKLYAHHYDLHYMAFSKDWYAENYMILAHLLSKLINLKSVYHSYSIFMCVLLLTFHLSNVLLQEDVIQIVKAVKDGDEEILNQIFDAKKYDVNDIRDLAVSKFIKFSLH